MTRSDILIIGSGPGGMEVAAAALRQGRDVTLIERGELGGTCLNRGCIPTKALCRSAEAVRLVAGCAAFGVEVSGVTLDYATAMERKERIVAEMRGNVSAVLSKARIVNGDARFAGKSEVMVNGELYTAPVIVIATGSEPALLRVEGASEAIDSDKLLSMTTLPERLVIVGGGVIGMEIACIMSAFGVKVTVLEYCKEILPGFDRDIAKRLRTVLTRGGMEIVTSAEVTAIRSGKVVEALVKGKSAAFFADTVLAAVGRRPVIPAGAEEAGVIVERGAIVTDSRFRTSLPGVYAVGDVNGRLMLAHVALAQGASVMDVPVNLDVVPAAVFTSPECAMVGLTEERLKEDGREFRIAKALFRGNGKAMASGETEGLVKLLIDADTRLIAGCHICGPHAADLIQEVAMAMSAGLTVDALASTIHAHPTLSEAVHAAASMLCDYD